MPAATVNNGSTQSVTSREAARLSGSLSCGVSVYLTSFHVVTGFGSMCNYSAAVEGHITVSSIVSCVKGERTLMEPTGQAAFCWLGHRVTQQRRAWGMRGEGGSIFFWKKRKFLQGNSHVPLALADILRHVSPQRA